MRKQNFSGKFGLPVFLLLLTVFFGNDACAAAGNPEKANPIKTGKLGKVLIVYYSFSGNTAEVAKTIQEITGGDIVQIEPLENYHRPDLEEVARKQVNEGYQPKIKNVNVNMKQYDFIFIGSPIWWFTFAPPIGSFLARYDLKAKKVAPFCTYIDVYGHYFSDVEKVCRGAKVLSGKDFKSAELTDMKKVRAKIEAWLRELEK